MAFDTLTYAKKLQEAGVAATQAEAHAGALMELVKENLATKRDLKELEVALRSDIKELEIALRSEIELVRRDMKEMETGLRSDMKEMETGLRSDIKGMETGLRNEIVLARRDTVIWLGGLIIVATTALGVLIKLL